MSLACVLQEIRLYPSGILDIVLVVKLGVGILLIVIVVLLLEMIGVNETVLVLKGRL